MSRPLVVCPILGLLMACGTDGDSDSDVAGAADAATAAFRVPSKTDPDTDGDGYAASVDCDDTDPLIHPGAVENDNLLDDDCDVWVDEDYVTAGALVITEVNRQARFGGAAAVTAGSWFEVTNVSARTIDLSNWTVTRQYGTPQSFRIDPAAPVVIGPGARAVFCESSRYEGSATSAWPLSCDYVWGDPTHAATWTGTWHNNKFHLQATQDTLVVVAGASVTSGLVVDSVAWTWSTSGYWPMVARHSMSLDPRYVDATLNDDVRAWCSTTADATGAVSEAVAWRWYDTAGTTKDEYGTPGAAGYDCPVDPDWDADGYAGAADCAEHDAAIHPGATETCDGVDQDCDGVVDDEAADATIWYVDADGDGFGAGDAILSCTPVASGVTTAGDCDDGNAGAFPGNVETCDGIDDDCDGTVDQGAVDASAWYADADGDGHGAGPAVDACAAPPGHVASADDCDDAEPRAHPGATEVCDGVDDDCNGGVDDGAVDATAWYTDHDLDGFGGALVVVSCTAPVGTVAIAGDCDDEAADRRPDAIERCDGVDEDCDGVVDDDALDAVSWFVNEDADGFGVGLPTYACTAPLGTADQPGDCDDAAADVNPAQTEVCDGIDDDCDGTVDVGAVDALSWYVDDDGDGFGGVFGETTCDAPTGMVTASGDCDDTSAEVWPGALETCDGLDQDCDGLVDDEAVDREWLHEDLDGDGFGAADATLVCVDAGWVVDDSDCDDTDAGVHVGATELRNGYDDDCDSWVDEGVLVAGDLVLSEVNRQARFGATVANPAGSWFEVYNPNDFAVDLSGWTVRSTSGTIARTFVVDPADGVVVDGNDYAVFCETDRYEGSAAAAWPLWCDYVWSDPTHASTWEGTYHSNKFHLVRDQMTLTLADGGVTLDSLTWTWDAVNGYWPRDARYSMSLDPAYLDATANDDRLAWCSTTVDASGKLWWANKWRWYDVTGTPYDEYGTPGYANYDCPIGPDTDADGTEDALDCDPTDASVYPGAAEVECDGVDQDCDGVDTCVVLDDCNGVDDDGDGQIDEDAAWSEWWQDADRDGYMDIGSDTLFCAPPDDTWWHADPYGWTDDCDATDPAVNPGAPEVECDGVDQDCDGADSCPPTGPGALSFDGVDDLAWAPGTAMAAGPLESTVEVWEKAAGPSGDIGVIGQHTCGVYAGWFLGTLGADGQAYVADSSGWQRWTAGVDVTDGSWHHLTLVQSPGYAALYVDGTLRATGSVNQWVDGADLALGAHGPGSTCWPRFHGSIGEVRIWTRALDAGEIADTMRTPLTGLEGDLWAWYDFREGSGDTLYDHSGNGRDAVLGSGPGVDSADPRWAGETPY